MQQGGEIDRRLLGEAAVVLAAIVLVVLVLWFSGAIRDDEPAPEAVPAPQSESTANTVQPAASDEERGDAARDIIASFRQAPDGPDYAAAVARAREFQAEGRPADAQLLYFFAARAGHAPAAFELARLYDPNNPVVDRPQAADPFQAFKFYRQAQDAGHEEAGQRLAELRAWTEQASEAGDEQASRLLLTWESSS